MKFLIFLSDFIMPLMIFYIVAYGMLMKRPIYDDFITGAKDGLKTVVGIMPTLIGLMTAVGVLRASGFLDFLGQAVSVVTDRLCIPAPGHAGVHRENVFFLSGQRAGAGHI